MASGRVRGSGFDKLARVYRGLEYASFGPLLWRTRTAFLPQAATARNALILGDGDGRFTAALLRSNAAVQVTAVDVSAAMLAALRARAVAQGDGSRVHTLHADATGCLPGGPFDLVCTHFFLDCLSFDQVQALACSCAARMGAGAVWIVSDFAAPAGMLRLPAQMLIRLLYLAFRVATGLRVSTLPDYGTALRLCGLACVGVQTRLFGILRSELWSFPESPSLHHTTHEQVTRSPHAE